MRILLTGGSGFLGSHVHDRLREHDVFVPRSAEYDLTDPAAVECAFIESRPEAVIHLAAACGGIGVNQREPGRFWYANTVMGALVLDACRRYGVGKTVVVGTTCSYPKQCPAPFNEANIWDGYPEETNAAYGIAKRTLLAGCMAYRQQYGLNVTYLVPANLYGPRDNFDPATSHVIPAVIRKLSTGDAVLWGDGSATRDFLYVCDAADAVVAALGWDVDLVNIGSGEAVSIREVAQMIAAAVGYDGPIYWDTTKPNGQPFRCLDTTLARSLGWTAKVPIADGIRRTVKWWRARTQAGLVAR
ncbi:MAG TPA: GDP-L-fucose synthase [Phycisphaerae bacterium]|nr:GDP-L-fucose synthase [Phycisphaerae bacterium]